ncbi:MAG TPA: RNA-binding S4 domain-containing protein [Bacillota bacterium]
MTEEIIVNIKTPTIKLDQFLKWSGIVQTGGEGKRMINEGLIVVNKVVAEKRGKLIKNGDQVGVMEIDQKGRRELKKTFIVHAGGE